MNTIAMNTNAMNPAALQPLLSTTSRIAAGVAVITFVAFAWSSAGQASHQAVNTATATLSPNSTYVVLPAVEVIGQRAAVVARTTRTGKAV
jgi:hypothetical protein